MPCGPAWKGSWKSPVISREKVSRELLAPFPLPPQPRGGLRAEGRCLPRGLRLSSAGQRTAPPARSRTRDAGRRRDSPGQRIAACGMPLAAGSARGRGGGRMWLESTSNSRIIKRIPYSALDYLPLVSPFLLEVPIFRDLPHPQTRPSPLLKRTAERFPGHFVKIVPPPPPRPLHTHSVVKLIGLRAEVNLNCSTVFFPQKSFHFVLSM